MRLERIIREVYHRPWLITPDTHASIRALIESKLAHEAREGEGICGEQIELPSMEIVDGIAHIPIAGAIGVRLTGFEKGSGAVDSNDIAAEIDEALEQGVDGFFFEFDSPGGMVSGTPELANKIAAIEQPKVAFAPSGMIASAAYWLASPMDAILGTDTSLIGSIGVYQPVLDMSGYYEQHGVKVELIKDGAHKGAGYPGTSLTDEQRARLQEEVSQIGERFRSFVSQTRFTISREDMEGQVFMGQEAVNRGFADRIVSGKAEALALLKGRI